MIYVFCYRNFGDPFFKLLIPVNGSQNNRFPLHRADPNRVFPGGRRFVNQLIARLRNQRESLKVANERISHYASTLENLTISRERNRMSRELHDTVVHTLSCLA